MFVALRNQSMTSVYVNVDNILTIRFEGKKVFIWFFGQEEASEFVGLTEEKWIEILNEMYPNNQ
jgi:hypothetical protein